MSGVLLSEILPLIALVSLARLASYLLGSMDHWSLGSRTVQIALKNVVVTHLLQGFVHFSAVAVGRSIVCSEHRTITKRSPVAETR